MLDLPKLEEYLSTLTLQRTQHQEMFHKLSGAIDLTQELINNMKKEQDTEVEIDGTEV